MSHTVTCNCGQRITVGPNIRRSAVACPACGKSVRLNGKQESTRPFGVPKDGGTRSKPPDSTSIAFSCPGCGKEFHESSRAAGKPTRCPKCSAEFVIPVGKPAAGKTSPPSQPASASSPDAKPSVEAGVEAAVAAYSASKSAAPRRRIVNTTTMVPIGFCLTMFGGLVATLGSFLMVKGSFDAFAVTHVTTGGTASGQSGGLLGPMKDYAKLLKELAEEPGGRQQPQKRNLLGKLPQQDPAKARREYEKQLAEQKEKRESGQALLIGGVITGSLGTLITFIGGIFLLAGLIGRFLQPQTLPTPANSKTGTESSNSTAGD